MFYVQKRKSVKTGKEYIGLFCDLGYRVACLSVDRALCSELLGISIAELFELPLDERRVVS